MLNRQRNLPPNGRSIALKPALCTAVKCYASTRLPCRTGCPTTIAEEIHMAKQASGEGVYKIVDVVGVSETSWEEAGRRAVETAAESLRDLRVAEVTKMHMRVENGKVAAFRTRVSLSFKYET